MARYLTHEEVAAALPRWLKENDRLAAKYQPRYTTAIGAGDDFYIDDRASMDVIVEETKPVDTGLIDQHGLKIWRLPPERKVGF